MFECYFSVVLDDFFFHRLQRLLQSLVFSISLGQCLFHSLYRICYTFLLQRRRRLHHFGRLLLLLALWRLWRWSNGFRAYCRSSSGVWRPLLVLEGLLSQLTMTLFGTLLFASCGLVHLCVSNFIFDRSCFRRLLFDNHGLWQSSPRS